VTFETALKFTLKWEGGYVNDPADFGGATNFGITQKTYDAYQKKLTQKPRSVEFITKSEVEAIYKQEYWTPSKCHRMVDELATVVFDTAVNFGVRNGVTFVQEALGLTQDGDWGYKTEAEFLTNNNVALAKKIVQCRIKYRHRCVEKTPSQKKFLQGWLNRDNALLELVSLPPKQPSVVTINPSKTLEAICDTYLKSSPVAASELQANEKTAVRAGQRYQIVWEGADKSGHLQISLVNNGGNWYIWPTHWKDVTATTVNPTKDTKPMATSTSKNLPVKYFSQRDNYRDASRTCFSSSNAMLLNYRKPGVIKNDDDYIRYLFTIGDSVDASTQLKTLAHFGLPCKYSQGCKNQDLIDQINADKPVPVGILHHGPSSAPSGGGHWILVRGYLIDKAAPGGGYFFVNDPWGELDNATGTYISQKGENLKYSFGLFDARWTVSSQVDGWAILA